MMIVKWHLWQLRNNIGKFGLETSNLDFCLDFFGHNISKQGGWDTTGLKKDKV